MQVSKKPFLDTLKNYVYEAMHENRDVKKPDLIKDDFDDQSKILELEDEAIVPRLNFENENNLQDLFDKKVQ